MHEAKVVIRFSKQVMAFEVDRFYYNNQPQPRPHTEQTMRDTTSGNEKSRISSRGLQPAYSHINIFHYSPVSKTKLSHEKVVLKFYRADKFLLKKHPVWIQIKQFKTSAKSRDQNIWFTKSSETDIEKRRLYKKPLQDTHKINYTKARTILFSLEFINMKKK